MDQLSILHLDLDAFYASVEQLEHPEYRGKPVIVGGLGGRGVVAAASYEARAFGVYSAIPMARARRACPHGIFLSPRIDAYAAKSRDVMAILESITPLVEPISLDEAFLDVSGAHRAAGSGTSIGAELRDRIKRETGLTASVGVARTKLLAKLGSDMAKPDGMLVVEVRDELEFLHPLPVSRLWGVGPATQRRLLDLGVTTVGELAQLSEGALVGALGRAVGTQLHALAWNRDDRSVEPERPLKSIGHEETFSSDRTDRPGLERDLDRLADSVARRARDAAMVARTVQIKVRYHDFSTITRSRTQPEPTESAADIASVARTLFDGVEIRGGIRLVGVSVSQLQPGAGAQATLPFDGNDESALHRPEQRALEVAVDAVRERFGADAVGAASAITDSGVRTGRRTSMWGPVEPERAPGDGAGEDAS